MVRRSRSIRGRKREMQYVLIFQKEEYLSLLPQYVSTIGGDTKWIPTVASMPALDWR